jgi:hypothetical protein
MLHPGDEPPTPATAHDAELERRVTDLEENAVKLERRVAQRELDAELDAIRHGRRP